MGEKTSDAKIQRSNKRAVTSKKADKCVAE
jgi:hypothetical protein